MDDIRLLQASHMKLIECQRELYNKQCELISHPFGRGQKKSVNQLFPFAALAEKYNGYADNYKKELAKFQHLLRKVQVTPAQQTQTQPQPQKNNTMTTKKMDDDSKNMEYVSNNNNNNKAVRTNSYQQKRNNHPQNMNRMNTRKKPLSHSNMNISPSSNTRKSAQRPTTSSNTNYYQTPPHPVIPPVASASASASASNSKPTPTPTKSPNNASASSSYVVKQTEFVRNFNNNSMTNNNGLMNVEDKKRRKKKNKKRKKKQTTETAERATQRKIETTKVEPAAIDADIVANIDFDVADIKEAREDNHEYVMVDDTVDDMKKDEMNKSLSFETITYESITKHHKRSYVYPTNPKGFEIYHGETIYTSTMLQFSGLSGLKEDSEDDRKRVIKILVDEVKFNEKEIEYVAIQNNRSSIMIYVRAALKEIQKRLFFLNKANIKKKQHNEKWRRQQKREREENETELTYEPIYNVKIYERASYIDSQNSQNENSILYVSNFDILNQNCHKAVSKLFLKFGDFRKDIDINVNMHGDPYAKIYYKTINDAVMLWRYHNTNIDEKGKATKLRFGNRTLNIAYSNRY